MIKYINEDITNLQHGNIVHGTNCQGVMNSGVAKAIRKQWPEVYNTYMKKFDVKPKPQLLGSCDCTIVHDDLYVFNAFTQERYGRRGIFASTDAIEKSLITCILYLKKYRTQEDIIVSMPKIGCGLGGLSWEKDVLPIVDKISREYGVSFNNYYIDK